MKKLFIKRITLVLPDLFSIFERIPIDEITLELLEMVIINNHKMGKLKIQEEELLKTIAN
jgi:hypothetical protein